MKQEHKVGRVSRWKRRANERFVGGGEKDQGQSLMAGLRSPLAE